MCSGEAVWTLSLQISNIRFPHLSFWAVPPQHTVLSKLECLRGEIYNFARTIGMTEGYFKQTGLHKFFLQVSLYACIIHILSVNLLSHHLYLSSNLSIIYLVSIYLLSIIYLVIIYQSIFYLA